MTKNISNEDITQACQGATSIKEVVERLGKTENERSSITRRMRALGLWEGVKERSKALRPYDLKEFVRIANETCNVSEIARRLNLGRGYHKRIRDDMADMGLKPNGRNKVGYTNEDVIRCAKDATSMYQLCDALGLKKAGGNCDALRKKIQTLDVDTSHWLGSSWSKGKQLKDFHEYARPNNFKAHLIKQRGHRCETCQCEKWNNKDIPLDLEHVDGNPKNNDLNNLKLLCCKCHSQTRTYRKAKR